VSDQQGACKASLKLSHCILHWTKTCSHALVEDRRAAGQWRRWTEQACVESVPESAEGGRKRRKMAAGCARSFTVAQQWQGADHQAAVPWKQISGVYGHEEERVPGRGRPRGARWGGAGGLSACWFVFVTNFRPFIPQKEKAFVQRRSWEPRIPTIKGRSESRCSDRTAQAKSGAYFAKFRRLW
jgi:hypothetical protein